MKEYTKFVNNAIVDYRTDGNTPNITIYSPRKSWEPGKIISASVRFSSGDAKTVQELREYIHFLLDTVLPDLEIHK